MRRESTVSAWPPRMDASAVVPVEEVETGGGDVRANDSAETGRATDRVLTGRGTG